MPPKWKVVLSWCEPSRNVSSFVAGTGRSLWPQYKNATFCLGVFYCVQISMVSWESLVLHNTAVHRKITLRCGCLRWWKDCRRCKLISETCATLIVQTLLYMHVLKREICLNWWDFHICLCVKQEQSNTLICLMCSKENIIYCLLSILNQNVSDWDGWTDA